MSLGFSNDMFQRGPQIGSAIQTVENSFYFGPHPLNLFDQMVTIDSSAADSGNAGATDILRPGLLLGRITSTGKLKQWSPTATDGSQFIHGILDNPATKVNANGSGVDRVRGNIMIRGQVNLSRLLIAGNASFGVIGDAYEGLVRLQLKKLGFVFIEDTPTTGLQNLTQLGAQWTHIIAKTADYTVKQAESGTLFTNRGASGAVIFTLPASPMIGTNYGFYVAADQSLTVASGTVDKMCVFNDAAADSVAFSVSGKKLGGMLKVIWDGTAWLTELSLAQGYDGTNVAQYVAIAT